MSLQQAGRLSQAEAVYRQILRADPDHPDALYHMGMLAQQVGKNDIAIELLNRAIAGKTHNIDAYINLGIILKSQGRLEEAITYFRRALDLRPDIALLHYNLGVTLYDQGKLDEAIASYNQALSLEPDFVEALCNLGVALKDQGKIDEAGVSFRRAIKERPEYAMAYVNLGETFITQGKLDDAVRFMQIAVKKAPGDNRISDYLVGLLNNYMPAAEQDSPFVKAQKSLQQVCSEDNASKPLITDETVRRVYQRCSHILTLHKLDITTNRTEVFRGAVTENDCRRNLMLFNTFNIIPEQCFSCFKVTFEPRTVMELFKLLFVFANLKLPNDNPQKCMVEVRPNMTGTYKGFIYCKSLNEGREILSFVQPIIGKAIDKEIPIFVKRGCSEFPAVYPEYGNIQDNTNQQMSYNEEWREHEAYANKHMRVPSGNTNNFTNDHSGFTLLDVLVMRKWLEYAAKIGDLSYRRIVE